MATKIKPDLIMFYVRIDRQLRSELKSKAALKGISLQNFVAETLAKEVNKSIDK